MRHPASTPQRRQTAISRQQRRNPNLRLLRIRFPGVGLTPGDFYLDRLKLLTALVPRQSLLVLMYHTWYTTTVATEPKSSRDIGTEKQQKRVPVIFFRTEAGGEPVRNWLKSLPLSGDRKRIGENIKTVEFGWPVGMPICKPLGDGIYEVRTGLAQNRIARVLFYIDKKSEWSCYTDSLRNRRTGEKQ